MSNILNDIMGVTSSAKGAYRYNMNLQHDAQNFAKWQMANSHQQEVADLQKAGLNPVLSAGAGGGASAGVSANSTGAGTGAGIDPISMANAIVGMINSTRETNAVVDKTNAETDLIDAQTNLTETTNTNAGTKTQRNKNDEAFEKTWWGRNISPAIRSMFGSGGAAEGAIAGAAVSQAATSAKRAKTPKRNKIGF